MSLAIFLTKVALLVEKVMLAEDMYRHPNKIQIYIE
jgi:hypothetical protein